VLFILTLYSFFYSFFLHFPFSFLIRHADLEHHIRVGKSNLDSTIYSPALIPVQESLKPNSSPPFLKYV
jgi:hypothetical protein